ncbi:hypothetical protein Tco_0428160 [Tanacetum coccineum]
MLAVRKVYQRAIVTPKHHVEQHWRDYENFKISLPLNRSPLGVVTNIIQEAKANANAFEEVAASLKHDKAQAKSQAMRGDDAGPQMETE